MLGRRWPALATQAVAGAGIDAGCPLHSGDSRQCWSDSQIPRKFSPAFPPGFQPSQVRSQLMGTLGTRTHNPEVVDSIHRATNGAPPSRFFFRVYTGQVLRSVLSDVVFVFVIHLYS